MDIQEFVVNRDQHMRPLEYDLSDNFNELLRYMQDMGVLDNVPVGTTSESEIVSISDAYPAPPRALTVYGKSTQAGTPTPDAPVPILSVDELTLQLQNGPNMLDTSVWAEGKYIGENGGVGTEAGSHYSSNYSLVMSGAYVFNMHRGSGNSRVRLHGYDKDKNWILQLYNAYINSGTSWYSASVTIPSNVKYVRVSCSDTMTELQLELGSAATAYEPYQGQSVPDLLPEGTSLRSLPDGTRDTLNLSYLRPSTRAGWAWYSREVVQRVHKSLVSELAWTRSSDYGYFSTTPTGGAVGGAYNTRQLICSTLYDSGAKSISGIRNTDLDSMEICYRSGYAQVYAFAGSSLANVEAFLALMGNAELQYPLATPVTTQLDPIELPQLPAPTATVWYDGGNEQPTLTLEYVRDANAALADLSEAIADIVSG